MEMNKKYSIVYLYIFRILKIIESFKKYERLYSYMYMREERRSTFLARES